MSFDNLYVSKIHYLRKNGKIPSHGVSKPAALSFFKHDEMIIALMVVVAKNPTQREIKHEKVVSLSRALNDMPVQLRVGTLSWLVLPGEEEPSSLIIHTHLSQEELARLAQFRLMEITRGKMHTNRFNFLNFGKSDVVRKIVEEAREQANQSTLVDSEAVVSYLK